MLKRMLSLLASLALLLTCGAAAVALGENELPIIKPGEKPDTPEEPTPLKTAADGVSLRIACVGASTTSGNNVPSDKGTSFPSFLQMLFGNGATVGNFGYPGASAIKGRQWSYIDGWHTENFQRMYADSLAFKADVVIIDMGGNDAFLIAEDGANAARFRQDYEELVTAYLDQEQKPLVLLATGGYCTYEDQATREGGNRILREQIEGAQLEVAAKYGLPTVSLCDFLGSDPDTYVCEEDHIHYTAAGYREEAKTFYNALLPLVELPEGTEIPEGGMMDPVNKSVPIGEYDGYRCVAWEKGKTGGFSYDSGAVAFAMDIPADTVVKTLTVEVSYYWDAASPANDWWWFNTTDKDGLSAPGLTNGNPHDNGFGTLNQYKLRRRSWSELTVTREDQLLGGADWTVYVGDLNADHSLYIRGWKITAVLQDGTKKQVGWGTMIPVIYPPHGPQAAGDGLRLKIACVGASTTAGNCVAEDHGSSYPNFLQALFGAKAQVRNFGYPGTCVTKGRDLSYIGSSYYKNSLNYMADVIIIDNGVNDSQAGIYGVGTLEQDYEEMVNAYRNQGNDPLILIVTGGYCIEDEKYVATWGVPGKKTIGKWGEDDDRIRDVIQPMQQKIAEKYSLPTVDLRAFLMSDPEAYICKEDGVHYTEQGYHDEAQMLYDALLPHLILPADKTALRQALVQAEEIREPDEALAAALAAAKAALADGAADQETVDGAAAALTAAMTPPTLKGDADGDGKITSTDARLALQLSVDTITEADVTDPAALDVDGDGKVTSTDARLILQKSVGKISDWP